MAPQQVPPQPVNTLWGFDISDQAEHVVVAAQHPMGTSVFFIKVETVDQIVAALIAQRDRAVAVQNGTAELAVVENNVVLGPDGQPMSRVPPSPEVRDQEAKLQAVPEPDDHVDAEPPAGDEDAGRRGD